MPKKKKSIKKKAVAAKPVKKKFKEDAAYAYKPKKGDVYDEDVDRISIEDEDGVPGGDEVDEVGASKSNDHEDETV
jgi:hypothetical protein